MKYSPIQNSSDFISAVKIGETSESISLDFKVEASFKKGWQKECALDIAQFANTWGGTLLYGIKEEKVIPSNLKKAVAVQGVTDAEEIKKRINADARDFLYPKNLDFEINVFEIDDKTIVAVNIPPLESGCASVCREDDSDCFKYPYRNEYGKKYMQSHQIEERMSDRTRNIQIKMNRLCIGRDIEIITPVVNVIQKEHRVGNLNSLTKTENVYKYAKLRMNSTFIRITEMSQSEFLLSIGPKGIHIPYSFVKEIWDMNFNKTGLALNCKLIVPLFDSPIQISFQG